MWFARAIALHFLNIYIYTYIYIYIYIYISIADLVHVPSTTDLKYQFILMRYLIFQFCIVLNTLYSKSL